jgi:hypothetical protein
MPRVSRPLRKTEARRRRTQDATAPRRFSIVRYCNGSPSWYVSMRYSSWESGVANSTGLCSTRAGVGVVVDARVHGVVGCGGGGKDLIAAEVVAGERGAEVGGGSGTGVDMLGGRELSTPLAPLKWTYSIVKLSYVGVELSSTALFHVHPRPSTNTTSRVMRTRCVPGSRMR